MSTTERTLLSRNVITAPTATRWPARLVSALLAVAVVIVHVIDQGGIPGAKDPSYVGAGYHLLEIVGLVTAVLLLARASVPAWLLALGVGAGPLAGYVLSRGPGLPGYTDDRGNWTEPLGLISLAVEFTLVVISLSALLRHRLKTA